MNWVAGTAVAILFGLIWLKSKFDPNDDAFRTVEREGWHFAKADVISLAEYREKRNERKMA